ncbi:MAG: hypothetical protein GKS05_02735 [Nitrospirales bacterium]|nr:hypothetical protein [Nitrospirales bacterium]
MKQWLILGGLLALCMMSSATAWSASSDGLTEQQKAEMHGLFEEWLAKQRSQEGMVGMPSPPGGDLGLGETAKSKPAYGVNFSGGSTLEGGRTIYAKPFVKAPKTIVGGYIDFTISDCAGSSRDCGDGLEFDQERFVPFFYSQVTDRLSVATELEIEHGGPQSNQGDGDVKIEFATMDYRFEDWINLRAGILLIPMGRFNLIHDSPLNDLPLRPMVSRLILPSTFAESGIGFYGTFYPTQLSKVDYEFYVTQGFKGDSTAGGATSLTEGSGLRSSRGSLKTDNNENKAIVSRISVSPILGIEVAGSVHHGKWDTRSKNDLTIWAVDGNIQRGPFELQGEAAWVDVEGGNRNPMSGSGVPPKSMNGYYVQGNFHFMPEAFKRMAPTYFSDASTFTAVVRWGEADTNSDRRGNANDLQRLTLGMNYRPVEDSVVKFAYTFNDEVPSVKNSGWQFSMATYF